MKLLNDLAKLQTNWLIGIVNKFTWALILFSFGLIFWRWGNLPPAVPLWYAKPWGAERLAGVFWIFLLPAGSLFWYAVNVVIAIYLTHEYLIFNQLLFLTSFLVSLFSLITLTKIIFLVT